MQRILHELVNLLWLGPTPHEGNKVVTLHIQLMFVITAHGQAVV